MGNGNKQLTEQEQQEIFQEIAQKYRSYILLVITSVLGRAGTREDAEELVQDTLYALWNHSYVLQSKHLKAYLCVTARNQAKNWLRGHHLLPIEPAIVEIPDPAGSLEDLTIQRELAQQLHRAIRRLSPKDREIFLRHYFYLQTAGEIAERLGVPRNTVLSRLARGRKRLQKTLNKEGFF